MSNYNKDLTTGFCSSSIYRNKYQWVFYKINMKTQVLPKQRGDNSQKVVSGRRQKTDPVFAAYNTQNSKP